MRPAPRPDHSIPAEDWTDWLAAEAAARSSAGLVRQRRPLQAIDAVTVVLEGREVLNFSGNDYLGLSRHPEVVAAMRDSAINSGVGSGASALVTGYGPEHEALESELAEFLGRERVLLCSSGYLANLAAITALTGPGSAVVQDRLCHASLIDGARLSGADLIRYRHADSQSAQRQLARCDGRRTLLVSDGVFSMDGNTAPLKDLVALCDDHGAWLMVDDAHGIGVVGAGGRGCVAGAEFDQRAVPVLVGTLGKAFGCAGAFVAGDAGMIEQIVNAGRSYIFDTALPGPVAAAARAALRLIRDDSDRRERLRDNISRFRAGLRQSRFRLLPSDSPIQPLVVGEPAEALRLSDRLLEAGFLVAPIRPPTVPQGASRLRVTLSSEHAPDRVNALADVLVRLS